MLQYVVDLFSINFTEDNKQMCNQRLSIKLTIITLSNTLLLLLGHFSHVRLCDPIDGSPPGFLSLGLSRQEHWNGLPFPSPMHESEK